MQVLGVSGGLVHDPACALVCDGKVLAAAEEERFTRVRHAPFQLPVHAARYCLRRAEAIGGGIDAVAFAWDPATIDSQFAKDFADRFIRRVGIDPLIHLVHIDNHLSHACAGLFTSPFVRAAVVVADGMGEVASTSIYRGEGGTVTAVASWGAASSLGLMYEAASLACGFGPFDAGKTMALAAFGRSSLSDPVDWFRSRSSGVTVPASHSARAEHVRDCWLEALTVTGERATIAANAQAVVESVMRELIEDAVSRSACTNVVLSGGVALNCVANGLLRKEWPSLHIFPAADDAGSAVGAAMFLTGRATEPHGSMALGPGYTEAEVGGMIGEFGLWADRPADLPDAVAERLSRGEVGAWFEGRMEFGPRALGNRSIVGRADDISVRDRINVVKGREMWRPLGPAVKFGVAEAILCGRGPYPYMIESATVDNDAIELLQACVHVDQSTRPLTVGRDQPLWSLLDVLERDYSIMGVVNTSFNTCGEPIVLAPVHAVRTFFGSGLDFLAIENWLLTKS